MIGLLTRALGLGSPFDGALIGVGAGLLAVCAICGIYKCANCRLRDCTCIKRCLHAFGSDPYEDFEIVLVIHEAMFQSSAGKFSPSIRVVAGRQTAETDPGSRSKQEAKVFFQQPLGIFVEQGTETISVELIETGARQALAVLNLDIAHDIMAPGVETIEKLFTMRAKSKKVLNPRVRLSIHHGAADDEEICIAAVLGDSPRNSTDLLLAQQMYKARLDAGPGGLGGGGGDPGNPTRIGLLMGTCQGPLDLFGGWGSLESVYVGIRGPPELKRYHFCIWSSKDARERKEEPRLDVDVMRIAAIQSDPSRPDVFVIRYVDKDKYKHEVTFRRSDRAREVWVESLKMLVEAIRETKEENKRRLRQTKH